MSKYIDKYLKEFEEKFFVNNGSIKVEDYVDVKQFLKEKLEEQENKMDRMSKVIEVRKIRFNNLLSELEVQRKRLVLSEKLPKKFNGVDLCAVREDFGWWVGYESEDLSKEVSATAKTLEEAFKKLNDYWFKSGRVKGEKRNV